MVTLDIRAKRAALGWAWETEFLLRKPARFMKHRVRGPSNENRSPAKTAAF